MGYRYMRLRCNNCLEAFKMRIRGIVEENRDRLFNKNERRKKIW